ncbi:MAG TPA: NAD(P)/FAD-dependent oxidoreductase [Gemmatimonadaceae bacterium]|nr:NAD(P)/FAD-dependent oxidoreductase [Gemmatimonadaceae bacterium]
MTAVSTFDAIVIGAGSNGLVAAAALGRAGRRVLVVERAEEIGGQRRTSEFAPGFRAALSADTGWLPPTVARGLALPPIDVVTPGVGASVAGDGGVLALSADRGWAADSIRPYSTRDAERWANFTERLAKLAGFLEALYQLPPPDVDAALSLGELAPLLSLGRKFRALGRADMLELLRVLPMSLQDLLDDWFESPLVKAAVAAGGVRDIRQGPRSGGTSFVLLHHLIGARAGSVGARPWWRDGPDAFISAVADVARGNDVAVRTGAGAATIVVRDDVVTGVVLDTGEEISAPIVVSTADPVLTLLGLVDPVWLDPEFLHAVRNIKLRGCTAFVRFALDRLPDVSGFDDSTSALTSTMSLTPSLDALERAYDAAKYGGVCGEPHIEITAPTTRWPSLAPAGQHVLLARVHYAPYQLRDGAVWDDTRSCELGETVMGAIGRVMPGFADAVLHREVLTPPDIETRFGVTHGAMTHGEMTLDQILFMRPVPGWGRYSMPIDGLYLAGSGAHPGPGVLGGAGWLAAKRILRGK